MSKLPTGAVRGTWDRILVRTTERKFSVSGLWGWGHLRWLLLLWCDLIFRFTHCHVDKITINMTPQERKIYTSLVLLFFFPASPSFIWQGRTIILPSNLYSLCCIFIILIGSESWGQSISQAIRHYFIQYSEGIGHCAKWLAGFINNNKSYSCNPLHLNISPRCFAIIVFTDLC